MSRSSAIAPSNVRTINGRVTFRDTHLRFRKFPLSDVGNDCLSHDVSAFGTGLLRAACRWMADDWYLCYQAVPEPNALPNPLADNWPAWVNSGVRLDPHSGVAVHGGHIYYRTRTGSAMRAVWDGSTLSHTPLFAAPSGPLAFAPVADDEVYLQWKDTPEAPFSKIAHYVVSSGTTAEWPGRLYSQSAWLYGFDAVRLNGRDRIYLADEEARRTLYITREGVWSEIRQLIPIDVVDDTSAFILGGAGIINNQIWLSGVLKRDRNFPMHIYTREITEDHYSLDREMFIRSGQTREKLVDGTPYIVPSGKLVLVGDILWYVAPGSAYYAYATNLCGCDRPEYKLQTSAIAGLSASFASNQPYTLSLDLASNLQSFATGAGCEVTLEAGYDGRYAQIGKFDISVGSDGCEQNGRTQGLLAHSYACKRMNQWEPDANFDYWSQTKVGTNPVDLAKLIRVSGKFSGTGELRLDRLNVDGYLYAVDRPSRNQLVRARFRFPQDACYTPVFGVVSQFYSDPERGENGLCAVYESGKISLRLLRGGAFTVLAEYAVTFAAGTWYWLQIAFHDGAIQVQCRQDGYPDWQAAITHTFEGLDTPWVRDDYVGRGGLYLRNTTPHSYGYPFTSTDMVVPVQENAVFPVSDTVIVDDELIAYSGKSHAVRQDGLLPAKGDAIVGNSAVENLAGWVTFAYEPGSQISAAIQTFQLPANYYVTGVRAYIKKNPGMTKDLGIAVYQGPRSEKKPVGVKIASGSIANEDLSESGAWVTANFGTPMFMNKVNPYWIVLYQTDNTGDPHEAGFELGRTAEATAGRLYTFNEDSDAWLPQAGDALFSLLGSTSVNAWTIILDNLAPPADPAQYNDMALIVTGGAGENEMFVVTGYGGTTQNGNHIVFVDRNPEGLLGDDTVFVLAPTLKVKKRGAGNPATSATYHGKSLVSLYRPLSVQCDYFNYYSSELDMRIEDVVRELAAKAGIEAYSDKRIPGSAVNSTTPVQARNFIVRFKYEAGDYTVSFRSGIQLAISGTRLALSCGDMLEIAGCSIAPCWVTVSLFENHLSVWANGYFLHAFDLSIYNLTQAGNAASITHEGVFDVDWSQCDQLRDNYIFDMGTSGLGLLAELLKERRIFYQDDSQGRLRLFRERVSVVNPDGAPYRLAALSSSNETDSEFASRIRLVGAEIAEGFDRSALVEHGSLFRLLYSQVLDYEEEIVQEVSRHLVDAVSSRDTHSLVGAFDPRLEPGDVISVLVNGDKAVKLAVDSLTVSLAVDGTDAALDMQLEGRRHIPYDGGSDIIVASTASPLDWSGGQEDPSGPERCAVLYSNNGQIFTFPATMDGLIEAFGRVEYNETLYIPPVDITFSDPTVIILTEGASIIGAGKDATLLRGNFHIILGNGCSMRDLGLVSDVGKSLTENYRYLVFVDHPSLIQNCAIEFKTSGSHAAAVVNRHGRLIIKNTDISVKASGNAGSIPAEAACIANLTRYAPASVLVFGGELVSSGLIAATQAHPPLLNYIETVTPDITVSGAIQKENA